MKNRNKAMYQSMKQSQGTPIDGQQMFEMLSAVANTLKQLQIIIGSMLEVQNRQNESIITVSDNLKKVANQVVELQKKQISTDNCIEGIFLSKNSRDRIGE